MEKQVSIPFPNKPWFLLVCSKSLLKALWEKEKWLVKASLFPKCYLPVWRTFFHINQIWNCRLQTLSVWKSLNLSFGKELPSIFPLSNDVFFPNTMIFASQIHLSANLEESNILLWSKGLNLVHWHFEPLPNDKI